MELNRDQIIKALECCGTPKWTKCNNCPREGEDSLCMYRLSNDALAIIKELTEENERLRKPRYQIKRDGTVEMIPTVATVRADTVRKIQERLDKHFCHDPAFLGVEQRLIMDVINQIAKEMVEGIE